jgi:hypothetical protein
MWSDRNIPVWSNVEAMNITARKGAEGYNS